MSDEHDAPRADGVDLSNRTVIITGATRGIGRALASGFARAGANVAVTARHEEACIEVAQELGNEGATAEGIPVHLADTESIEQLVQRTVARFGGIDIVVNNAATGLAQRIGELTVDAWDKSMAVNLRGPVFLVERALPYLRRSPAASVLNIISPGAFIAAADWAMYAAAKAALLSFTRSYAAALGRDGIRVNALCPGPIDTEIFRSNPVETQQRIAEATALGRVGAPDEMVGPAHFLTSGAASYVTGEVLFAHGGTRG
jgi:NAD(P)-dependent dehydrogenase (short-subunit alcohol dehydrogenase family)